jgi:hypothetical protein
MALQATESGKTLTCDGQGYNLAGTTVQSVSLITLSPQNQRAELPLVVDLSGTTASRTTTANDFPVAGDWKFQMKVYFKDSTFRLSPPVTRTINPAL